MSISNNLTIGSESIITDDDKNPNLNEADLQELNRSKALSVIPSKVPVGLASKLGLKSSSESVNIVSSLIGSSTDDSLRKLNLESVIDAFPSKDSSFDKNFSHFISAPTKFGTLDLPPSLANLARLHKKDSQGKFSIETSLKKLKDLHKSTDYQLSPEAFIELAHALLSGDPLITFGQIIKRENFKISDIFEQLCIVHGTIKSAQEIVDSIHQITTEEMPLFELAKKFMTLVDSSGSHYELASDLCKAEFLKEAYKQFGLAIKSQLSSALKSHASSDFRILFKIIKESYLPHFEKIPNRRSVHNINLYDPPAQPNSNTRNEKSIRCYNCNKLGHISKECFLKKNKQQPSRANQSNRTPPPNSYALAICSIHRSGHNNMSCNSQKSPCDFKPSHASHNKGNCFRAADASKPAPSQSNHITSSNNVHQLNETSDSE